MKNYIKAFAVIFSSIIINQSILAGDAEITLKAREAREASATKIKEANAKARAAKKKARPASNRTVQTEIVSMSNCTNKGKAKSKLKPTAKARKSNKGSTNELGEGTIPPEVYNSCDKKSKNSSK